MSVDLSQLNGILARLETVADRLEKGVPAGSVAGAPAAAAAAEEVAPIVVSYDMFIKDKAAPIKAAADAFCVADVAEASDFFLQVARLVRGILVATATCRKPKDDEWQKFFGPVVEINQKANKACDNRSEYFSDRKASLEAMGFFMMVTAPQPAAFVQNALESMDFHGNKVLQKKNPPETAWMNALKTCLKELVEWCKENCKLGLSWKPNGEDPVAYFAARPLGSEAAAAPKAAGGKGKGKAPPMPKGGLEKPPPELLASMSQESKPAAPQGGGMADVFAAITERGTTGLKKVTDDMKCKNMKDAPVKASAAPKAAAPKAVAGRFAKGPKGPPIKELQKDVNWIIENFEGDNNITVDEADMKQCICIINCKNCTVRLSSRVKAITVDGCEKVNVLMKDVISAVELVNSDRLQIQADGTVKMIAIDKCNGVQLHLNKDSLDAEIVTAKSSEMNVNIPDPDSSDALDTIEIPIPEQFVTTIVGKKTKTAVSSLYSD